MSQMVSVLLLIICSGPLVAQKAAEPEKRSFSFFYGNDITGQTDQYYTNGVRFDLTMPSFSKSPFSLSWLRWQPGTTAYHTLNFRYDVYTPDLHKALNTDRPFAAVMMLGSKHQYVLAKNNMMLTSEFQLGIIGQAAGAGKLQNGLHKIMPGADWVEGWETQIRNSMGLNYIFSLDKQVHRSKYAEIIFGGTAFIGSPFAKLESRVLVRVGLMEDYFNLLQSNPQNKWRLHVYGDFRAAYNIYNATIQGGLLNSDSPYVITEIEPFVLDLQLGLAATYKVYTIKLGQHLITPEFSGATTYKWGELTITVRF
jgi:lipid A 3-O-deacylase